MTADRSRVGVRAYVDSLKRLFGGFFCNGSIGELWSWLLGHNPIMQFFMALFVGIVAGIGAVAFLRLIAFFHKLFFFCRISFVYNSLEHTATSVWGPFIILAPALGGLCVAWMIQKFAPEAECGQPNRWSSDQLI
jgi:CIC family chloride channel protein